jgi:hypothetical protein
MDYMKLKNQQFCVWFSYGMVKIKEAYLRSFYAIPFYRARCSPWFLYLGIIVGSRLGQTGNNP